MKQCCFIKVKILDISIFSGVFIFFLRQFSFFFIWYYFIFVSFISRKFTYKKKVYNTFLNSVYFFFIKLYIIYESKFYRAHSEITFFSNTINFKQKNLVFDSLRIDRNLISTYIFRKDQTVTEKKFESMSMFNLKVANDISSR